MTSVDRIETTAGMTRAATSAKDGIMTVGTGALESVAGTADDCAFDAFMKPRSALSTTPKATEAMMIAIVDRIRLVVGFMLMRLLSKNGNWLCLGLSAHLPRQANGWVARPPFYLQTNELAKSFGGPFVCGYEQHK